MAKVNCYCSSEKLFSDCCEPYLSGTSVPETAEQLMRSRYSAFATLNQPYLEQTWHPEFRPKQLSLDASQQWIGLKIMSHQQDGDAAVVHFVARYKIGGKGYRQEESSLFSRIEGRWYYCHPDRTQK